MDFRERPIPELQDEFQAEPRGRVNRQLYQVRGPWPTRKFLIHNSNRQNLGRGLAERVFRVEREGNLVKPPQPLPGQFGECDPYARSIIKKSGGRHCMRAIDRAEFPALYKDKRRRTIYQNAVDSLEEDGWKDSYGRLTTFVKAEKIDATAKGDPAPRVIQPRKPEYNVELGVVLKPFEHRIYDAMAEAIGKSTIVAKGINAVELGNLIASKWERFNDPVAIGLDASRFDQHVSLDALEYEHGIYMALCERPYKRKLARLLELQRKNRGVAMAKDGGFRYEVDGCRMSGDMNTALGNCILMCSMTVNLVKKLGLQAYDMINNGDDMVLFVERADLSVVMGEIPTHYLNFGFTMKVEEPVSILEQIEFCQMRPVQTATGYVMTRNWDVVLSKDLVTLLDIPNEKRFKQWMTAISDGGLSVASGMPILQEFYKQLNFGVDIGKIKNHGAFDHSSSGWAIGLLPKESPIEDKTRVSFALAFGLSESEQLVLESTIRNWRPEYQSEDESPGGL